MSSSRCPRKIATWPSIRNPASYLGGAPAKCDVVVLESALIHIYGHHLMEGQEPECEPLWQSWLTPGLLDALRVVFADAGAQGVRHSVFQRVVKILESAARQSVERPLVLLYRQRRPTEPPDRGIEHWILVCANGALQIMRERSGDAFLKTCYFPRPLQYLNTADRRWAYAVKHLVETYAPRHQRWRHLPSASHMVQFKNGVRSGFRYVLPETWGFQRDGRWRIPTGPWMPDGGPSPGGLLKPRRTK
jgi:hypothetical protein